MSFFGEIVGQPEAVNVIERAAEGGAEDQLAHAWLITGPPGSGRSNLALRFAAALIAQHPEERERVYEQVRARTHPDAAVLTTQKVQIGIDDVRDIVAGAHFAPSQGRHRVIVIEDADRMPERTSNVLLKALEEPPERTVWLLCAPSEADLLPTIRSRARSLRLVTPQPAHIAELLASRDGISTDLAERAARLSQNHIGMARRLATNPEVLERRNRTIELALEVQTLSEAMRVATELLKEAQADADAITAERDTAERADILRSMGIAEGAAIPAQLRSQVKALEDDQKRRATRSLRDGIDRIFTDLLSLYRDVLLVSLGSGVQLVNIEHTDRIEAKAAEWGSDVSLDAFETVETARQQLARGVTPGLVLEAMFARIATRSAHPPPRVPLGS